MYDLLTGYVIQPTHLYVFKNCPEYMYGSPEVPCHQRASMDCTTNIYLPLNPTIIVGRAKKVSSSSSNLSFFLSVDIPKLKDGFFKEEIRVFRQEGRAT